MAQTLEQWIEEALNDPDKEGACTGMSLMHMVGSRREEVHAVALGNAEQAANGASVRARDSKKLARLFEDKAESYSGSLSGVQMFCLLAFYGGRNEHQALHPFTLAGASDFGGLQTEGPNSTGLTAQAMRHAEVTLATTLKQSALIIESYERLTRQLTDRVTGLTRENYDSLDLVKQVILERASANHELKMKELEFARSSNERAKLLEAAPALVNTITGREVFPQSSVDTAIIQSIATRLTPDMIAKLAGIFPAEVWAPIATRLIGIMDEKKQVDELSSKPVPGLTAEEDAAGDVAAEVSSTPVLEESTSIVTQAIASEKS
jgi:hypothetical protein